MDFLLVADSVKPSSSGERSLRRIAGSFGASLERHPASAFALLSASYLVIVALLSHNKLLWLDELITLHIAKLGSVSAIWHALAQAADPNPPLTHLAVLASIRCFGESEFALRLPAILGYWIGLVSLFLFLRRRLPIVWALAGTVSSMANASFDYSYESRSYGIFYGLAMLAVLCWSRAVDPTRSSLQRSLALGGMVTALALGLCTNYFAVLAFFPTAGGEMVRILSARRQRWSFHAASENSLNPTLWIALAVAALPLLGFRRLIQTSIAHFAPHAWNKVTLDKVFDSYTEMVETILFPVVALLALVAIVYGLSRLCAHCRATLRPRWLSRLVDHHAHQSCFSFPLHEVAATLILMVYPFLGYLVASIHGGMLSSRFVIPVCLGFAIAGAACGYRLFGHLPYAGSVALALCSLVFLGRVCAVGEDYHEQKQCFYQILNSLPAASMGRPIVVPDPLMVVTLAHYAPPSVASRIVFPVDFPAIRLFRGEDSPDENLWAGRGFYPFSILPLAAFQSNTADYLILASDGNWLVRDLWNHSYPVSRLPNSFPKGVIKGFTPLDHGDPVLFVGSGDRSNTARNRLPTVPFHARENLPESPELASNHELF